MTYSSEPLFDGDQDRQLRAVQDEVYTQVLTEWFVQAMRFLMEAEIVAGRSTLRDSIPNEGRDPRSIQYREGALRRTHDLVAAAFRYQLMQPTLDDPVPSDWRGRFARWQSFALNEIGNLMERDPRFARSYLEATAFQGTPVGDAAEREREAAVTRGILAPLELRIARLTD